MDIKRKLRKIAELGAGFTAIATLILLAGCGGGSRQATGEATPPGGGGSGLVISGVAVKGPMSGATATAYAVDSKGSRGSSLGSDTTTATGEFKIPLSSTPTTAISIEIAGGSYTSETDGVSIPATKPMSALLPLLSVTAGASGIAVTPLSDMAHAHAIAHAATGIALDTAISDADKFITKTFGLSASSPTAIIPDFTASALTAKTDGGKSALAIAALDGLVKKLKSGSGMGWMSRDDVYAALSDDYSDGLPDGKKDKDPVMITSGTDSAALPATALGSDLTGALSSVSPSTFTGTGAASAVAAAAEDMGTTVTSIIPASVLSATGLSSSSSGAMSYASIAGKQYLFIAARCKGVRKVDVTDPAAPVELTASTTPAWHGAALVSESACNGTTTTSTTSFKDLPIGGAMVVSGSTGVRILAFAYGAKHIALLDPDTGAITYEGDLILAGGLMNFSGGQAYIAGAIPDPGKGAWLATTDGYVFLDINATLAAGTGADPVLGATKFATAVVSEGSGVLNQLAENLGGDIAHNLLFTPNYGGLSLQIVADQPGGLAHGSYQLDPAYVTANSVPTEIMDGGAVDTGWGVGIITYEDTSNASFINLNGITAGTGATAGTFSPPATHGFVDVNIGGTFSGSAVDSKTHQVFGMAGYSSDIFVGQLQNPAIVAAGDPWLGMTDWVSVTNLTGYSEAHDPHANAIINNDKTGKTYAYLLDGDPSPTGVRQIDVSALLALPRGTGAAAHQLVTGTDPTSTGGPITTIALP